MTADPIHVALATTRVLERLGIPYLVGGSVASTVHGEPRTTMDVDLAVQLTPDQVPALCSALEPEFFVQPEAVEEAAARHVHCNLVHRATMTKVDIYVRPPEGLYASEIARARPIRLREGAEGVARIATPEDVLLQKLRWYREGGEVSDRQWRDVLGIVKHQVGRLDLEYCERWATELGLHTLLERALAEGGGAG